MDIHSSWLVCFISWTIHWLKSAIKFSILVSIWSKDLFFGKIPAKKYLISEIVTFLGVKCPVCSILMDVAFTEHNLNIFDIAYLLEGLSVMLNLKLLFPSVYSHLIRPVTFSSRLIFLSKWLCQLYFEVWFFVSF